MLLKFNTKFDLEEECLFDSMGNKVDVIVSFIRCSISKKAQEITYDLKFKDEQLQQDYGGFSTVPESQLIKLTEEPTMGVREELRCEIDGLEHMKKIDGLSERGLKLLESKKRNFNKLTKG